MTDKKQTILEIEAEIKRLQAEIVTRKANAKTEIRADIEKMLSDAGVSLSDIYPELNKKKAASAKGKGKGSSEVKALFKDPVSGVTWSGRGRAPKWVTELCDQKGVSLEQFKSNPEFRI
jgi:DNA-binding protein H-NS